MDERPERAPIVEAGDQHPGPELQRRVRQHLAAGGLCALPTETVYGIAARADHPAAVVALRELKGRPGDSSLTWHVCDRSAVERFEPLLPLARRLVARYWPGPLTLVLRGVPRGLEQVARDGWTGVRAPAHAATLGLLGACDFPVAITSANRHREKPLTRALDVAEFFGPALELVVDGGPSRLGEASGVLRLGPGHFELLREGLLRLEDLRRAAGLRLAFVCTGNTCRSPIAELLARMLLRERLGVRDRGRLDLEHFGFEVASMGVLAASGAPASPGAVEVLAQRGLDLAPHRSRPAVPEVLARFDRIYGLTRNHIEALLGMLPPGRHPPLELLDPLGRDIADPLGGGQDDYRHCVEEIEEALRARLDEWA